MIRYNKRRWLNSEISPSTGNIVCFDGDITHNGNDARNIFVSISDCYNSARLHMTEDDSVEDFVKKITLLRDELTNFINHLNNHLNT
jgi:hypothetical protein